MMRATRLRTEMLSDPLGLDCVPRFSWIVEDERRGASQTSYRVRVASSDQRLSDDEADLWDSGPVASSDTHLIDYGGKQLTSGQRAVWDVSVWDDQDRAAPTSDVARFEMGLLDPTSWSAQWISAPPELFTTGTIEGHDPGPLAGPRPVRFTRQFTLAAVELGRLHVTARGLYSVTINGHQVGMAQLTPGWTDYDKQHPYQTLDVSELLTEGENWIGIEAAAGWWCGQVAWKGAVYGEHMEVLAQLHVEHAEGSMVLTTDEQWTCQPSPRLWADLQMGEAIDLRQGGPDWAECAGDFASFDVRATGPAAETHLVAHPGPLVQRLESITPVRVDDDRAGTVRVDLGQNIAGRLRVRLCGSRGAVVAIRHAEMLEADGTLHTANYRTAACTDLIVLGDGEVIVEPQFSFRGFRHAEITALSGDVEVLDVLGIPLSSMSEMAGDFSCSNAMLNQLVSNVRWSLRGNFIEVPTDCPQRDERLGWSGDIQVFAPTASWLAPSSNFLAKWCRDLRAGQVDGVFPDVAPLVDPGMLANGAPGWGDAGAIVPWVVWQRYGDKRILQENYAAMRAWVDRLADENPNDLWLHQRGNDYGDWLSQHDETPKEVLATAYFAHSTDIVAKVADILGHDADAEKYRDRALAIRRAFMAAYVTPDGRIVGHSQTAYALALTFQLLPDELQPAATNFLRQRIVDPRGFASPFVPNHVATGFLGVSQLLEALLKNGEDRLAYQLLENETFPSWGYSIKQGATTIWERWDGWTHMDGFKPAMMNSFNHYALGSVVDWLFRVPGGIEPDPTGPGFANFTLAPRPGGTLTGAKAWHDSPRGRIHCDWSIDSVTFELRLEVPTNTTASLILPRSATNPHEDGIPLDLVEGVTGVRHASDGIRAELASGSYLIQSNWRAESNAERPRDAR